jgi:excisionase family DNA binding protein
MSGPLLDAEQVGALLNVPASWVRAQAREGRIPHLKLGKYTRFDADEIERWRQSQLRKPGRER